MEPRITDAHEAGDVWRVREAAEPRGRADRMGPLVHELIAWDLVVRTESGTFVLSDDVQRRLREASARQWTSTPEVYVGRPCHRCGTTGVTRMVGEARLCDACSRASVVEVEPERPSRRHVRNDGRSWWGHKAG